MKLSLIQIGDSVVSETRIKSTCDTFSSEHNSESIDERGARCFEKSFIFCEKYKFLSRNNNILLENIYQDRKIYPERWVSDMYVQFVFEPKVYLQDVNR